MRSNRDKWDVLEDGTLELRLFAGSYAYELVYMKLQKEIYIEDRSIIEYADKIKRVKINYSRTNKYLRISAEYNGMEIGIPDERFEKDLNPCVKIKLGKLL